MLSTTKFLKVSTSASVVVFELVFFFQSSDTFSPFPCPKSLHLSPQRVAVMAASFQQYMGNKGAFHPQGEKAKYSSDQANLNRQHIGDQNRLPVPITTLHHGQTRVSRQKKSPGRKISPQTRNRNNNLQTNNGITHHQGLFDTDAEDGDRTTTLSEISKEDLRYQNVDFANTKPRYQPEYSPASSIHAVSHRVLNPKRDAVLIAISMRI